MEQIEQVNEVLREIGADHIPQILVWNKIDAAGLEPAVERDEYDKINRVFISAHSGAGLDLLRSAIAETAKSGPGQSYRATPENEEQDDAFELAEVDASVDALPDALPEGPADHLPTSTLVGPR